MVVVDNPVSPLPDGVVVVRYVEHARSARVGSGDDKVAQLVYDVYEWIPRDADPGNAIFRQSTYSVRVAEWDS